MKFHITIGERFSFSRARGAIACAIKHPGGTGKGIDAMARLGLAAHLHWLNL